MTLQASSPCAPKLWTLMRLLPAGFASSQVGLHCLAFKCLFKLQNFCCVTNPLCIYIFASHNPVHIHIRLTNLGSASYPLRVPIANNDTHIRFCTAHWVRSTLDLPKHSVLLKDCGAKGAFCFLHSE